LCLSPLMLLLILPALSAGAQIRRLRHCEGN
jgi:hypothetical protein